MGLRGPPPKPTALRRLEGNPSRRPLNDREPQPRTLANIEAPNDLPPDGKMIWASLVPELIRIGLLSVIDTEPFYRYVKDILEYREADKKIEGHLVIPIYESGPADGPVGKDGKPTRRIKYLMQNPYISIRNQAAARCARAELNFGLTPSARARMIGLINGNPQDKDDEDPYAA